MALPALVLAGDYRRFRRAASEGSALFAWPGTDRRPRIPYSLDTIRGPCGKLAGAPGRRGCVRQRGIFMTTPFTPRHWSSRFAFLMAAIGSAVGLGNVWRFPYLAGENGGGAFILIYAATTLAIALPILISEIMLGRMGKQSPINAMRALIAEHKAARFWMLIGWGGIAGAFVVLSYYSVIGGWALKYVELALTGAFSGET